MPSIKVYLNEKLYKRVVALTDSEDFSSNGATVEHYFRLGLNSTLPRPHEVPTTTPSPPHTTRESINEEEDKERKRTNASRDESDPIKTPKKKLNEQQAKFLPMTLTLIEMIRETGTKKTMNQDVNKCVVVVEMLTRIEKIPSNEIIPSTKWALADEFYDTILLSIPQWRKPGGNGMPKFWNMWKKWQKVQDNGSAPAPAFIPTSERPQEPKRLTQIEKDSIASHAADAKLSRADQEKITAERRKLFNRPKSTKPTPEELAQMELKANADMAAHTAAHTAAQAKQTDPTTGEPLHAEGEQ